MTSDEDVSLSDAFSFPPSVRLVLARGDQEIHVKLCNTSRSRSTPIHGPLRQLVLHKDDLNDAVYTVY